MTLDIDGWRLSQDQFRFLEDVLREAILEEVDRRLEAHGGAAPRGRDSAPDAGEILARAMDQVDRRLDDRLASHQAGLLETVRGELERRVAQAAESLEGRLLEAVARQQAAAERSARGGRAEQPRTPGRPAETRRVPLRSTAGALGLVLAVSVAAWASVAWKVDRSVEARDARLASLASVADRSVSTIRAQAVETDSTARYVASIAAELRRSATSGSLRRELVAALREDRDFRALTTGPPGPRGPEGPPPPNVTFGAGFFTFQSPSGSTVASVGASDRQTGSLRLLDASAGSEIGLYARPGSGTITVGTARAPQAFLEASGGTTATLGVRDASGGGGVVLRAQGGLGAVMVNGKSVLDLAEVFELSDREGVVPGTVLAVAGDDGRLAPSREAYDRRVVGVVSGAGGLEPGLRLGSRQDGTNDLPVALVGQVYVRVSPEGGAISAGDLLVASSTPGVAMRATHPDRTRGAVLGKALGAFTGGPGVGQGDGLVRMLVMPR